jgi:Zn-dependent protease with chaperone function
MRYLGMGLAFASVGFVAANVALSSLTFVLWRAVRSRRPRSRALFLMRMLPSLGSAFLVLGFVLPAYGLFEPRATSETAGPILVLFVAIAAAAVLFGLRRAVGSWLDTRRIERRWTAAGVGDASLEIPARTYRVPCETPIAALVGVVRPRLFVSDRFFDALSAGERRAVVAHERAHLRSRDNLKRTLIRLAPDGLCFLAAAGQIEIAWALAAEEDADDEAAGPDRSRALDLAGALIKGSRLTPTPIPAVSGFCDESTIARRVSRLLQDGTEGPAPRRSSASRLVGALVILTASAFLLVPALRTAYAMTEAAVRLLQ